MSETDEPGAAPGAPSPGGPSGGGHGPRPDRKLLELLVCPLTKTPLAYDRDRDELVSPAARLAYPIRDGIPIMLASEARRLEE